MAMTCTERRAILSRVQQLVNELIQVNDSTSRMETQLGAQGVSAAEIQDTIERFLNGAGPPRDGGVALGECDGDTLSGRIVNMLNDAITGSLDWVWKAE